MPKPRYSITVVHGEAKTAFHVVCTTEATDEQPAALRSFVTRLDAMRYIKALKSFAKRSLTPDTTTIPVAWSDQRGATNA